MENIGMTPIENATEKKQFFIFENGQLKDDIGRVIAGENLDGYESEKLQYLTTTFKNVVEQLNGIKEYAKKADELGIRVRKDFDFVHIYKAFFDTTMCKEPVDWKEFSEELNKYENNLKNAIEMYRLNQNNQ